VQANIINWIGKEESSPSPPVNASYPNKAILLSNNVLKKNWNMQTHGIHALILNIKERLKDARIKMQIAAYITPTPPL